jgi:acetylornithine/succinyldiaminopimelate/putrescine aminotransferase/choline dehydrogenase-like flavoprotein
MMDISQILEEQLTDSVEMSKKYGHPRMVRMFEIGGINTRFLRAEGQYLFDAEDMPYLDLCSGGGVFIIGRNHPVVNAALKGVLEQDLPNLTVVNPSILSGLLAKELLEVTGPGYSKVLFSNSGTESTDLALRFARFITRRRRFVYLHGAFHGRTYAASSVCGFEAMREGMEPLMPTCTPIHGGDLGQLRRELSRGDVAAFIFEPVQGMTLDVMDAGYMREAEALCRRYGTVMIADEVQCGLARAGEWFVSTAAGARPDIITLAKGLSGGQMPVSATIMSDEIYAKTFAGFQSGYSYFSTFAENNLAMAAGLATVRVTRDLDAPARGRELGAKFREGVEALAQQYDIIDRVAGQGLMQAVYFRDSGKWALKLQQKLLGAVDSASIAAAVNVDLHTKHQVIVQIPGPGVNAIKILPPAICSDEDVYVFLAGLEETLKSYYETIGPVGSLVGGFAKDVVNRVQQARERLLPADHDALAESPAADPFEDMWPSDDDGSNGVSDHGHDLGIKARVFSDEDTGLFEFEHYQQPIRDHADVVVVGSGPGGAMVAWSLAQQGKEVIVLEAGPPARIDRSSGGPRQILASYFDNSGGQNLSGNASVSARVARCLGGSSVFDTGICLRMPATHAQRWQQEHGLSGFGLEALEVHYAAVEGFLGVESGQANRDGRRNELFRVGAEAIGLHPEVLPRSAPGCSGSGRCHFGCLEGAKRSLDRRGIPEALERGARVYTSVRAERLLLEDGRVSGVVGHVVDPVHGTRGLPVHITAERTILAAGALSSPHILLRSGIQEPAVGANLQAHLGAVLLAQFEDEVLPWQGATVGYGCYDRQHLGISLESLWAAQSLLNTGVPALAGGLGGGFGSLSHMASWCAWTSGEDSVGRVRLLAGGLPRHSFELGEGDIRRLQEGTALLSEMAFAAGATRVLTSLRGESSELPSAAAIEGLRRASLRPSDLNLTARDLFGTCAMGSDPERSVCGPDGAVHGVDNLHVCDASLLPSSPGVDPALTLMAIAHRMGQQLAEAS